jgi:hypothetical protein
MPKPFNDTPYCPIVLAALFAGPKDVDYDADAFDCRGSMCAWWRRDQVKPDRGSCGMCPNGQQFQDPARAEDDGGER